MLCITSQYRRATWVSVQCLAVINRTNALWIFFAIALRRQRNCVSQNLSCGIKVFSGMNGSLYFAQNQGPLDHPRLSVYITDSKVSNFCKRLVL